MSPSSTNTFIALSSALTGFKEQTLTLALQAADFQGEFVKYRGNAATDLINQYQQAAANGQKPADIVQSLLASAQTGDAARALIVFWYTGQISPTDKPNDLSIPGPNFYAQGLQWRAVQAHPTGVSHLQFGYWADEPPALDKFL